MPSITQLRYLLAVHTHKHFGKAADELGISQPTLSTQIKKVELELGVTLFDRQAKPIALTKPGWELIELAQQVVSSHHRLISLAKGKSKAPSGKFTLGIIPTLAPYVLPWFLRSFSESYPAVELTLMERPTDNILQSIAANQMDAAILTTPLYEATLCEQSLFYDPFYIYAHNDSSILGLESIAVTDIDSKRLWLLEDEHCFRTQVLNLCGLRDRDILTSVQFAGGSFETLRHLIDSCGGYTLIPETYARTLPRSTRLRQVRPFGSNTPTREVSLVYHRQNWKQEIIAALGQQIETGVPRYLDRTIGEGESLPVPVIPRGETKRHGT